MTHSHIGCEPVLLGDLSHLGFSNGAASVAAAGTRAAGSAGGAAGGAGGAAGGAGCAAGGVGGAAGSTTESREPWAAVENQIPRVHYGPFNTQQLFPGTFEH